MALICRSSYYVRVYCPSSCQALAAAVGLLDELQQMDDARVVSTFCTTAVLETGGPNGSTSAGEHEFSVPGLCACPDGKLSPFLYGARARIAMDHAETFEGNCRLNAMLATQFVFREETVEGGR